MVSEKARENRLRRRADRLGYALRKDRARVWGLEHRGEYALADHESGGLSFGWNFDASLDEIEQFLNDAEARLRSESPAPVSDPVAVGTAPGEQGEGGR